MAAPDKANTVKSAILASLAHGCSRRAAAVAANIGNSTLADWVAKDAAFAEAVEAAEVQSVKAIEDALWRKAKSGHPTAMIFWLCNREPERWRNVQHTESRNTFNGVLTIEQKERAARKELAAESASAVERFSRIMARMGGDPAILSAHESAKGGGNGGNGGNGKKKPKGAS
jgi:hypothetical protein